MLRVHVTGTCYRYMWQIHATGSVVFLTVQYITVQYLELFQVHNHIMFDGRDALVPVTSLLPHVPSRSGGGEELEGGVAHHLQGAYRSWYFIPNILPEIKLFLWKLFFGHFNVTSFGKRAYKEKHLINKTPCIVKILNNLPFISHLPPHLILPTGVHVDVTSYSLQVGMLTSPHTPYRWACWPHLIFSTSGHVDLSSTVYCPHWDHISPACQGHMERFGEKELWT